MASGRESITTAQRTAQAQLRRWLERQREANDMVRHWTDKLADLDYALANYGRSRADSAPQPDPAP